MEMLHAVVLGAVQGFTEILPVSSSAHLILIPWLLKWPESGLTFDVALHLGTFIALTLYFWRDIMELFFSSLDVVLNRSLNTPARRLPFFIILATIPAAIVGKMFEKQVEEVFRSNHLLISFILIAFGLLLGLADLIGRKRKGIYQLTTSNVIIIGLMQCLALIPGVSRSGITITAGLALGFTRESAARFSFLMSLPIVAGAAFLKSLQLVKHGVPAGEWTFMLVGIAVSAVTGFISVAFLFKLIQKQSLLLFVLYRLVAGIILINLILSSFYADLSRPAVDLKAAALWIASFF